MCHELINLAAITLISSSASSERFFKHARAERGLYLSLALPHRSRSRRSKRLRDWLLVDDGWRALIVSAHVRLDGNGTGGDGVSRGRGRSRRIGGRRVDLLRPRQKHDSVSPPALVCTHKCARLGSSG